jgi:hypothetical protein
MRPCASFPPSSCFTAVSILCVARWRSARGMIEWLCTELELELIQTQMAQKPVLRAKAYARALRASQT